MSVFEQVSGEHPIGRASSTSEMAQHHKVHHGSSAMRSSIASTKCENLNGCFQNLEDVRTRSQVPLLGSLPVDDIPDVLNVCSLAIQVL
jgi:hypothetical protein